MTVIIECMVSYKYQVVLSGSEDRNVNNLPNQLIIQSNNTFILCFPLVLLALMTVCSTFFLIVLSLEIICVSCCSSEVNISFILWLSLVYCLFLNASYTISLCSFLRIIYYCSFFMVMSFWAMLLRYC
jgi:hypothetical protein